MEIVVLDEAVAVGEVGEVDAEDAEDVAVAVAEEVAVEAVALALPLAVSQMPNDQRRRKVAPAKDRPPRRCMIDLLRILVRGGGWLGCSAWLANTRAISITTGTPPRPRKSFVLGRSASVLSRL